MLTVYLCTKTVSLNLSLLLLMASPFGVNSLQDDPGKDVTCKNVHCLTLTANALAKQSSILNVVYSRYTFPERTGLRWDPVAFCVVRKIKH